MPVTEISRIPLDIGSKAILVQELYCINHEKCRRVINGAALIFIYLAKYLDFWIDSRGKLSIFSSIYKTFKSKKERYETQNIYILIISILKISIFEKEVRKTFMTLHLSWESYWPRISANCVDVSIWARSFFVHMQPNTRGW